MGYILEDALNKLFKIYRKSCKKNEYLMEEEIEENKDKEGNIEVNIFEDEESFEDYVLNHEIDNPISKFDLAVLNDIESYLVDLASKDYEEFDEIASLLTLEYYNLVRKDMIDYEGYLDEDNAVISDIEKMDKSEFLEALLYLENGYLSEIIGTIINEYDPESDMYVEYDYVYIENIIDEEKTQQVYKKFHPNLVQELVEYQKYLAYEDLLDKVSDLDIDNLFKFIYTSLIVKNLSDKDYQYIDIMRTKLNLILTENEDLYDEIVLYLIKFNYIYLKSKDEITDLEQKTIDLIEEDAKDGIEYRADLDFLIQTFYNYDLLKSDKEIDGIGEDINQKIKKFKNIQD